MEGIERMSVKLATPQEAKGILDADPSALYLDVRTEREFAAGHPEGAVNIPAFVPSATGSLQQNPEFLQVVEHLVARDARVLCGCQVGGRSQAAGQLLVGAGYTDVTNVIGGFAGGRDPRSGEVVVGWRQAGLPVATSVNEETGYPALRRKAGLG